MQHHIAFLIEHTHQRLRCLLNPESLVVRRAAGIEPRRLPAGAIAGDELSDAPLLYTGGGRTELELDLLFDVSLADQPVADGDVRSLTRPLWQLTENHPWVHGRPPTVRLIWGKSWNLPGVVVAIAENLEHFTTGGVPRRSWLRMRLVRVPQARVNVAGAAAGAAAGAVAGAALGAAGALAGAAAGALVGPAEELIHELLGGRVVAPEDGLDADPDPTVPADIEVEVLARVLGAVVDEIQGEVVPAVDRAMAAVAAALAGGADDGDEDKDDPESETGQRRQAAKEARGLLERLRDGVLGVAREVYQRARGGLITACREIERAVDDAGAWLAEAGARVSDELSKAVGAVVAAARRGAARVRAGLVRAAEAVRVRAQAVIAAAHRYARAGIERVAATLDALGKLPAAVVDAATEVLGRVRDALAEVARLGAAALAEARAALTELRDRVTALVRAGAHAAARVLRETVAAMAVAVHNAENAVTTLGAWLYGRAQALWTELRVRLDAWLAERPESGGGERPESGEGRPEGRPGPARSVARAGAGAGEISGVSAALDALEESVVASAAPDSDDLVSEINHLRAAVSGAGPVDAGERAIEFLQRGLARMAETGAAGQRQRVTDAVAAPRADLHASGERLDLLAYRYYGHPAYWRLLARANDIDFPLAAGERGSVRIPARAGLGSRNA
ncbi:hypothetical protein [Haliangium sp.]|uniref:CIS tube protein n=1 Tax=Haliangium sp. TaxID=2663208 RepID=UPI003D1339FC